MLEQQVDTAVTVEGVAQNAMAGAVVVTDERLPVYPEGVERWDGATEGKRVTASGVLRRREGSPLISGGEHRHGLGPHFALERATWSVR